MCVQRMNGRTGLKVDVNDDTIASSTDLSWYSINKLDFFPFIQKRYYLLDTFYV